MRHQLPLSSTGIEDLSDALNTQARAYAAAREAGGVDTQSFDVDAAREALKKTERLDAVELPTRNAEMAGVPVVQVGEGTGPVLLFLHGGGFVGGNWRTHGHICDRICRAAGMSGVFVNYRLAPEHRFPAAFDDVERVFDQMPEERPLVIAGDSVGGALALHLARLDRSAPRRRISAMAFMAPMLDFDERTSDYMRSFGRARKMIGNSLSQDQVSDPRLQFSGQGQQELPPILIQTGGADYVKTDGHRLALAIASVDGPVVLEHWPHMPHVWHRYAPDAPEANDAIDRAGAFLADHV